jgi:hypothetical protein
LTGLKQTSIILLFVELLGKTIERLLCRFYKSLDILPRHQEGEHIV